MSSQISHIAQITSSLVGGTSSSTLPVQDQLVSYYNLDDVNSYNFTSTPQIMTSLTGTNHGVIANAVVDVNATPSYYTDYTVNGFGTDGNGDNYIFMNGSFGSYSGNNIYVSTALNLTNWSYSIKYKHRRAVGLAYKRFLGTRNYLMELGYNNNSELWYYQSGWVNTGIIVPNDGQFHNIDWTYQNSPRLLSLYLDGVLVYQTSSKGVSLVSNYYHIMGSTDNSNTENLMNKNLIYGKTLTQSEIIHNLGI
jgi:hypothetical protein